VQALGERGVLVSLTGYPRSRGGAPGRAEDSGQRKLTNRVRAHSRLRLGEGTMAAAGGGGGQRQRDDVGPPPHGSTSSAAAALSEEVSAWVEVCDSWSSWQAPRGPSSHEIKGVAVCLGRLLAALRSGGE
jgi:hypothetical protein